MMSERITIFVNGVYFTNDATLEEALEDITFFTDSRVKMWITGTYREYVTKEDLEKMMQEEKEEHD